MASFNHAFAGEILFADSGDCAVMGNQVIRAGGGVGENDLRRVEAKWVVAGIEQKPPV